MSAMSVQKGQKSTVDVVNDLVAHWLNPPEILVIDDDPEILLTFRECIAKLGCTPYVASTGAQAEQFYTQKMRQPFADNGSSQHPFDLVFLDLKMPGMKGGEVLKTIRTLWPLQPVVIISGVIEFMYNHELTEHGPISIMTKPISLANIRDCILMHNIRMKKIEIP